jgi:NTE family protein
MRPTAFLRSVPILAGLSEEQLGRLALEMGEREVRAGEWILHEGEPAESAYIVRSGRVEVVDERPPEALIRILRRGDVLGELALLREGIRSASARASRDTELVELTRSAFEGLIQEAPSFALALTRALGAQLAASRTPVAAASSPRTIAVVGLDPGAAVAAAGDELADALSRHGSLARLKEGGLGEIDRAERDADRVLLQGSASPADEWTRTCVQESDLVVAITAGTPEREWLQHARPLWGCELISIGGQVSAAVTAALQPRELQVILNGASRRATLEATARRMAGRALGIVLSGGGARALAHLGALEELRAAGLRFDRIAGVSLGSLVAASTAMGLEPEGVYESFYRGFAGTNPTRDFAIPAFSLLRGATARRLMEEAFGDRRIEELPLRFFCASCDLTQRELVVHRSGRIVDAVYPSMAIPGVFPPMATSDGRLLVDGGVLDNLPVATMARSGEGPVIAVDVTGGMGRFQRPQRPGLARAARRFRRMMTGSEAAVPGLGETLVRTLTVGSIDTVVAARLHADLVITPQVDGIGLMEWRALERARELGRDAARQVLAANPNMEERLGV